MRYALLDNLILLNLIRAGKESIRVGEEVAQEANLSCHIAVARFCGVTDDEVRAVIGDSAALAELEARITAERAVDGKNSRTLVTYNISASDV